MVGTTLATGPVTVTIHTPRTVLPGDGLDVVIRASAVGRSIISGEVTLTNRVVYRYRQFNAFGGAATATADHTDVVDRQQLAPVPVDDPPSSIGAITLRVPDSALPSVAGNLVQISWRVVVRLHVPGEPDAVASQVVRVLSAAPDNAFVTEHPPRVVDRHTAVVNFEVLSGRWLRPNSTLTGLLTVVALKPITARALRVELILQEQVHHGPWAGNDDPTVIPQGQEKEAETPVVTATVATALRMGAQRQLFPFALAIPESLPGPSVDTPEFSLKWLLRGVLDRVHRPDPFVEVDLHAVTAPE